MTHAAVRFLAQNVRPSKLYIAHVHSMSANADATSAGGKTRHPQQGYEAFPSFLPQQMWQELEAACVPRERMYTLLHYLFKGLWLRCPSEGTFGRT